MGRISVTVAIVSGLMVVVSAQRGAPAPATQQPVFRSATDLIQVDTVVVDKNGTPVRGLTKDDFEILDNGKPQSVVAVNEFHHDRSPAPVASDVAANADERLVVLVLDDGKPWAGTRSEQRKDIARAFVRALAGHAQMALVRTSTEPGVEFTSNAQALLDALDMAPTIVPPFRALSGTWMGLNLNGRLPDMAPPETLMTSLAPERSPGRVGQGGPTFMLENTDFNAVRDGSLSANDGRRKVFIVISEGEFNDGVDPQFLVKDAKKNAEGKLSQKGLLDDLHKRFTQILDVALRSNSAIYAVHPRETAATAASPTADIMAKLMSDALAALTAKTGGYSLGRGESLSSKLDRVMEDIDHYYVLGFSPSDRRTRTHTIAITVKRPDLVVRHRTQYGLDDVARDRAVKASAKDPLLGLAYSPVPAGDVPLRAWATVTTPVAGRTAAPISLWLDTGGARLDEYAIFVLNMNTNKEAGPPLGRSIVGTVPALMPLEVPALAPGRYQLRIAVRSAEAGRGGSVYLTVEIPDFAKAPLAITNVVIGAGDTRRRDVGALPFVPSLDRTFARTARLRLAFDVWRQPQLGDARAVVEIVTPDGTVVKTLAERVLAGEDRSIDQAFGVDGLAPGAYTLRITATAGTARVVEEIGFRIGAVQNVNVIVPDATWFIFAGFPWPGMN